MSKEINIITLDISLTGGIERVISVLANQFTKMGFKVTIYSLFKKNQQLGYDFDENINIEFINTQPAGGDSLFGKIKYYLSMFKSIAKVRYSCNGHVLSTLTNISCILGLLNCFGQRVKFIAAEHSQYYAHSRLIQLIRRYCYRNADAIVSLTINDAAIFKQYFRSDKVEVIVNPVSFQCEIPNAMLSNKRLVTIGRLVDVKGYDNLLKDLQSFFSSNTDWSLDIYGEGEDKDDLIKLASTLGIKHQINFKGFVRNVQEELQGASLYLCSSKTEAFPMSFLEAFSVGIPVISYDCPVGPKELISDNVNGFLLGEHHLYSTFTGAIKGIIEMPDQYSDMVDASFVSSKKYNIEMISNSWIDLLNNIK
jgi:glycosyltransferase involved in cell wall biosynthesis